MLVSTSNSSQDVETTYVSMSQWVDAKLWCVYGQWNITQPSQRKETYHSQRRGWTEDIMPCEASGTQRQKLHDVTDMLNLNKLSTEEESGMAGPAVGVLEEKEMLGQGYKVTWDE